MTTGIEYYQGLEVLRMQVVKSAVKSLKYTQTEQTYPQNLCKSALSKALIPRNHWH
jgi:hypothetical protein